MVVLLMLVLSMDGVDAKKGKKKGKSKRKTAKAGNVVAATDVGTDAAGFPLGRNDLYSYRYQQKVRQKVLVPFFGLCSCSSFRRRRLICRIWRWKRGRNRWSVNSCFDGLMHTIETRL